MLLFLINAVFRGAGDASLAMRVLWIANLINIVLNPLLIFGLGPFPRAGRARLGDRHHHRPIHRRADPDLDADARARAAWWCARAHFRFSAGIDDAPDPALARRDFSIFRRHGELDRLVRMVASFGSAAVAGYTVAMRIFIFAILPSWGMANAAATLVGQNLGADKPDRAEQSVWRAGFYNMIFLGLVAVTFVIFARPLVSHLHQRSRGDSVRA